MGLKGKKAFLALPAVVFGADWMLKRHIDKTMEPGEKKEVCGKRLVLQKHYNEGAAFGLFRAHPTEVTAVHAGLLAGLFACYAVLLSKKGKTGLKISTGLLLGGGLGNLADRLQKRHVVDYISLPAKCKCLERIVFNLSDVFVLLGAAFHLLFANLERQKKKERV